MIMDIGLIQGIWTIMVMIIFIGIVIWAYSGKKKKEFEEAANLPFCEEDEQQDNQE